MGESPEALARLLLHSILRRARERSGLTQVAVAESLSWPPRRVALVEQATRDISREDVGRLLDLYHVEDTERALGIAALTRSDELANWEEFKDAFSSTALDLYRGEPMARTIYKYEPTFVPVLLRTERYTRALAEGMKRSPRETELWIKVQRERQKLFELGPRPRLLIILGEAVIGRPIGGRKVMGEQVAKLRQLASSASDIVIQVLPFAVGAHPEMGRSFTILEFKDPSLDDRLYLEDAERRSAVRMLPSAVARHRDVFRQLQQQATPRREAAAEIQRIAQAASMA